MNKGFMKKRTVKMTRSLFALIFGVVLLSGCAATPDSSVVRQKGSQSQDTYREADTYVANADETNAGEESDDSLGY